jgi:hypothetical protein
MVPRGSSTNARYQPFAFTLDDLTKTPVSHHYNPDADEAVLAGARPNAQTFALPEDSRGIIGKFSLRCHGYTPLRIGDNSDGSEQRALLTRADDVCSLYGRPLSLRVYRLTALVALRLNRLLKLFADRSMA